MKVLLILVDGMRPDAMVKVERAQNFLKKASYSLKSQAVMPTVTLPCHVSLFLSVDPSRHGTTTNVYAPQVRPVDGLCEVLRRNGKRSAFFYNWEELRDLSRPGSLTFSYYCKEDDLGYDETNNMVTDAAIDYLAKQDTDFAFLYLGSTDMAGHIRGWMSQEYMDSLENSWENIDRIVETLPEDYVVIVTADHGGHERSHGTSAPEDMDIPILFYGKDIKANTPIWDANIKDIAPTITKLLGVEPDAQWEGTPIL